MKVGRRYSQEWYLEPRALATKFGLALGVRGLVAQGVGREGCARGYHDESNNQKILTIGSSWCDRPTLWNRNHCEHRRECRSQDRILVEDLDTERISRAGILKVDDRTYSSLKTLPDGPVDRSWRWENQLSPPSADLILDA
jgi:hypothetical protein